MSELVEKVVVKTDLDVRPETLHSQSTVEDNAERVAILELLHGVNQRQVDSFIKAVALPDHYDGENPVLALDLGAGVGFAANVVIQNAIYSNVPLEMHTLEVNGAMVEASNNRAQNIIKGANAEGSITSYAHQADLIQHDITDCVGILPNSVDIVTAKMFLHETQFTRQTEILAQVYDILKPGGSVVIWGVTVPETANNGPAFPYTDFIKRKDEIAGRTEMAARREFTTKSQLTRMLGRGGFSPEMISIQDTWTRKWNTIHRWFFEFGNGDPRSLVQLNEAAGHYIPDGYLQPVSFSGTLREYMDDNLPGGFEALGLPAENGDKEYAVTGYQFGVPSAIIKVTKT